MDRWQYALAEMEGKTYDEHGYGIPVLTYEEVAGLVLGFDPWEMGLQMHQVSVDPLLDKIGVEYNPNDKFKGKSGEFIGQPESPNILKFFK
jgi:heterodisulfide reductase subunit B